MNESRRRLEGARPQNDLDHPHPSLAVVPL